MTVFGNAIRFTKTIGVINNIAVVYACLHIFMSALTCNRYYYPH